MSVVWYYPEGGRRGRRGKGFGAGVYIVLQWYYMRDKHYPVKAFRISEEVYRKLLELKKQTGLSHNLLFKLLLDEQTKKDCITTTRPARDTEDAKKGQEEGKKTT